MTQERTHTWAVGGITPLIQLWLEAVLCAFVSLAQGVAATLGMMGLGRQRDWHTHLAPSALPQAKPDIQIKDPTTPTASFSALCRETLLDPARERADAPREAINRDPPARPEDDTGDVAAPGKPPAALMVSSTQSVRPSNHEGGLTNLSPLIPTKVGIQGGSQGMSHLAATITRAPHNRSWMPTSVGMSGTG